MRIVARKHNDGRIEFALQQRHGDTWGDRQLPRSRFFPTTAITGRWLTSTPITVQAVQAPATTALSGSLQYLTITGNAASGFACALRTDGTIACSGGRNKFNETDAPDGTYTAIAAGDTHACAIATDGTTTCWGNNSAGLTDVPRDHLFESITAGSDHTCGLDPPEEGAPESAPDGDVYLGYHVGTGECWGARRLPGGSRVGITAIAAGYVHTCALATDGTIDCSGRWSESDGTYTAIAAGEGHTCAIATDGTIDCWGDWGSWRYVDSGQSDAPDGTYTAIAAGGWHTCAIATDGTIDCWGSNVSGQSDAPDGTYTAIAAGSRHTCAIATDGTTACWGVWPVELDDHYTAIATSGQHICAIATDGTIDCWGDNSFGQRDAPDGTYTAIAAGGIHSCAIRTDRTIACWGGRTDRRGEPTGPTDAPDGTYTAVAAMRGHTCAIATDSTMVCWGIKSDPLPGEPEPVVAPDGQFTAFTGDHEANDATCGIRTDGSTACPDWLVSRDGLATGH
ncbi:MAG: hypothetical protein OXG55_08355 [bacterium]|nr:hypothetical protein [bacterium]